MHAPALAWQVAGLPLQVPEQHSAPAEQDVPLAAQVVAWQVPAVQMLEQHCEGALQLAPLPEQVVAWQLPLTQKVEQHSAPEPQVVPLPEQAVAWQVPLVQKLEQHCEPALQAVPLERQAPPPAGDEALEHAWSDSARPAAATRREARRRMVGYPRFVQGDEGLAVAVTLTIRSRPPSRQRSHRPTFRPARRLLGGPIGPRLGGPRPVGGASAERVPMMWDSILDPRTGRC